MGEIKIAHSFREANDFDASSGETNMVRFKTLGQKKIVLATDPSAIVALPTSQVPLPTVNPILALAYAVMGLDRAHQRLRF